MDNTTEDTNQESTEQSTPVAIEKPVMTDIFQWANNADRNKDELEIDLFLFTKGYTVYATKYDKQLKQQLKVLFLYDMINTVQTGAATGMSVRDFEAADAEDNVLMRTDLEKVEHAQEVIEQIAFGEESLDVFIEGDHEFKKVKGMIARFSKPGSEPFYVTKILPQTQVLKGATAWMFMEGSFQPFSADAGLKVTQDNQVLIVRNDVFVFSETKFERLFGYSAKKFAIAEEKIKEIEKYFKFSFPEGLSFDILLRDKKTLVSKLQKVDPQMMTQEQLLDHSDEMGLELMADEATGAIIIMDANDATTFVNLLNDDYVMSGVTGIKYEVKNKKPLRDGAGNDENPLVAMAERP